MSEPQDGALVGQSVVPAAESREVPKQGHVVQGFFHRWVAEGEPLLHEVDVQQGFDGEWGVSSLAFGQIRCNQGYQARPWHDALHLAQEFALAGAFGRRSEGQACLLHGRIVSALGTLANHGGAEFMQTFPSP